MKHLIVTGASRGLGRELANALSAHYSVLGLARHEPEEPYCADFRKCDITREDEIQKALRHFAGTKLWGLINNAGAASMNHALLTPTSTFTKLHELNVVGTFLMCRAAAKLKVQRIINISTVAVPLALAGEAAYVASKAGVEGLTRVLARELAPTTVNAIGPAILETALTAKVPEKKLQEIRSKLVFDDCSAKDVVHATEFLLHEDAARITGQVLYLGGVW